MALPPADRFFNLPVMSIPIKFSNVMYHLFGLKNMTCGLRVAVLQEDIISITPLNSDVLLFASVEVAVINIPSVRPNPVTSISK